MAVVFGSVVMGRPPELNGLIIASFPERAFVCRLVVVADHAPVQRECSVLD